MFAGLPGSRTCKSACDRWHECWISCAHATRPGGKILGDVADLGANALEVAHERLAPRLHMEEAEVVLVARNRTQSTARA